MCDQIGVFIWSLKTILCDVIFLQDVYEDDGSEDSESLREPASGESDLSEDEVHKTCIHLMFCAMILWLNLYFCKDWSILVVHILCYSLGFL